MRAIERHLTLTALAASLAAPAGLVLSLVGGDWHALPSAAVLVALLISVFLFVLLRLVLLPAFFGRPPRSRWLLALISVLGMLGLVVIQQLTQRTGAGTLLLGAVVSLSLFVLVEATARSG